MSVLSYQSIKHSNIFKPFCERTVHPLTSLTYGCGAASYDVRLGEDITLRDGFISLSSTLEHFTMPNNLCAIVHDKSSLARMGILVQNTFIDPGWRGYLTLEISYHPLEERGSTATKTYYLNKGTPIAQIVFHVLDEPTEQPYDGVYQNQREGAVPSKVKL